MDRLLVAGCHRSGTSMLAGVLREWLLNVSDALQADFLPPSSDNLDGFFESRLLVNTSESLLDLVNASWDRPFLVAPAWNSPELLENLIKVRHAFHSWIGTRWVHKDPRVSLLLPAYRHILLQDVAWLGVVRNPVEVANSLELRNGFDPEKGALLWWLYYHHLLQSSQAEICGTLVSDDGLLACEPLTTARVVSHVQQHWSGPCRLEQLETILKQRCKPSLRRARKQADTMGPMLSEAYDLWLAWRASGDQQHVLQEGLKILPAALLRCYATQMSEGPEGKPYCSKAFAERTTPYQVVVSDLQNSQLACHQAQQELHNSQLACHQAQQELHNSQLACHQTQQELHNSQLACHQTQQELHNSQLAYQRIEQQLTEQLEESQKLRSHIDKLLRSTSWQLTRPLRWLGDRRRRRRTAVSKYQNLQKPLQWLWISGEPSTPGHHYRVEMPLEAVRNLGHDADWMPLEKALSDENSGFWCTTLEVVIIWRSPWSIELGAIIDQLKLKGTTVVFDLDDAMVDPALAKIPVIDGIRSMGLAEAEVAHLYAHIRQTLVQCNHGLSSTEVLAQCMRATGTPTFLLANGFSEERLRRSIHARRQRRHASSDGLLRLGYASGTRTHQRDFGFIAGAVASVLKSRPDTRLVLFREGQDAGLPTLDVEEYPELKGLETQIEWRPLVPVEALASELARFDINLVPLDTDSTFCQAKSELKYFEAALVDVCTIASPTAPFAEAIEHGQTGWLASTPQEWESAINLLLEEPERRQKLGKQAHVAVLWPFGPEKRRQSLDQLYRLWRGDITEQCTNFLQLLKTQPGRPGLPVQSDSRIVFEYVSGDPADVAVLIPVYNYAHYLPEALESVLEQHHPSLELMVVDDGSTDDSQQVAAVWMRQNHRHFRRCVLLANSRNSGLAITRNNGFSNVEAPLVFPLDPDNLLKSNCLRTLQQALDDGNAAAAHPSLSTFGNQQSELMDTDVTTPASAWDPARFQSGNYIDAMALIRRAAWAAVGGYSPMPITGWEDFQFWCKFVEAGLWSQAVPEAEAGYRVHDASMLHTVTMQEDRPKRLAEWMKQQHPWLDLRQFLD